MSYKAFEFSLKTEYVFAENAVDALKTQLEKLNRQLSGIRVSD